MVSSVAVLLLSLAACINDPNANLSSDHPDKAMFEHAMSAMEGNRLDVARMTLQTLLNTYPDSQYAERATTSIARSPHSCL
jgi:outer membrane protein assembly factor BamD